LAAQALRDASNGHRRGDGRLPLWVAGVGDAKLITDMSPEQLKMPCALGTGAAVPHH
jgi:hypothetical protein